MNNFSTLDNPESYDDFLQGLPDLAGGGIGSQFTQSAVTALTGNPVGGLLSGIEAAIGSIGSGRKEADQITPIQSQYDILLQQVNAEMGNPNISIPRLQDLRATVQAAGVRFKEVINRPWKDGRAAKQADATYFGNPGYLRVTLENIDKMLAARGVGPTATPAAGGSSTGLLVAAAAAAFALFK